MKLVKFGTIAIVFCVLVGAVLNFSKRTYINRAGLFTATQKLFRGFETDHATADECWHVFTGTQNEL